MRQIIWSPLPSRVTPSFSYSNILLFHFYFQKFHKICTILHVLSSSLLFLADLFRIFQFIPCHINPGDFCGQRSLQLPGTTKTQLKQQSTVPHDSSVLSKYGPVCVSLQLKCNGNISSLHRPKAVSSTFHARIENYGVCMEKVLRF